MALSLADHRSMLAGFAEAGFVCTGMPTTATNPVRLEWHLGSEVRRFRLWCFDVTHGGGGRNEDEFRIQVTNGPSKMADFDDEGRSDLLIGYVRDRDVVVGYDRRWLEIWTSKKEQAGSGGSPSVQVHSAEIEAARRDGIHRLTKDAGFGAASIVTMTPDALPDYLFVHGEVLSGTLSADAARGAAPRPSGTIDEYCRRRGFQFEPDLIARYLAALLTKPFVILAGVSGTGKSKLAELIAHYYSSTPTTSSIGDVPPESGSFVFVAPRSRLDPTRFALVAVRPDWTDHHAIFGFLNPITERYESTQALDLVLRADSALDAASERLSAPRHFMLLDEMNLARVEHYFSDWLACAESRRPGLAGSIEQQPVQLHRSSGAMETEVADSDGTSSIPEVLDLPTNLVVTGTVNVDETTHGFSPKVLDRAMVLEFDEVNLERLRGDVSHADTGGYRFPETLPAFGLPTLEDYASLPAEIHGHLVAMNGILEEARLHLGYRAALEVARFVKVYAELLPNDSTGTDDLRPLDAVVLQKVLPRLSGNRARLELPLAKLCAYLKDLEIPLRDYRGDDLDAEAAADLPRSYRRALDMLESLREFGFVSFFK